MKILSIGNSFSEDAQKWLHKLAVAEGCDLETANLYIGGCTLERHWNNMKEDLAAYELGRNGEKTDQMISLLEALTMDKWDVVTLQQASGKSGMPESYLPYLDELAEFVRQLQPQAAIWFHQTWAYESDFTAERYGEYDFDQRQMYTRARDAAHWAAKRISAGLIPVGDVIQNLREQVPEFDYQNGGLSLCRDGFHLSLDYGRFAAAACWLRTLTGQNPTVTDFQEMDPEILKKILTVVCAQ